MGGDGQLYTTLEDLLLWDNNFYNKKIGGQALFDQQHKKYGASVFGRRPNKSGGLGGWSPPAQKRLNLFLNC